MNNKSKPTNNGKSLNEYVSSFNDDEYVFPRLDPGNTPIFHVVILLLDGFNKSFDEDEKYLALELINFFASSIHPSQRELQVSNAEPSHSGKWHLWSIGLLWSGALLCHAQDAVCVREWWLLKKARVQEASAVTHECWRWRRWHPIPREGVQSIF